MKNTDEKLQWLENSFIQMTMKNVFLIHVVDHAASREKP